MSELMSVFVLVSERHEPVRELYHDYKRALDALGRDYELMYVLDGDFPDTLKDLVSLQEAGERIRVLRLGKTFGEATALTAAYRNSRGDVIVTLPAYWQIEPSEIPEIVRALDDCDMVIARRWPRIDSTFNRIQNRVFHWLLNFVTGVGYRDLGCGVRAYRRQIADEVPLYGDQHRFLPVLADQRGFRVKEVDAAQSSQNTATRVYRTGIYLRRLLDILTVFFLVKFTKKPLRFFGLLGSGMFAVGGIGLAYAVVERLAFDVALADRPVLLLSSLLIVLGVQLFALGLIGELIIFSHASELREYTIREIISRPSAVEAGPRSSRGASG